MLSKRLVIGFVLVIILFSLFIYSSIGHERYDPDFDYKIENFEKFNNTEVTVGGKIKEINLSKEMITIWKPLWEFLLPRTVGTICCCVDKIAIFTFIFYFVCFTGFSFF